MISPQLVQLRFRVATEVTWWMTRLLKLHLRVVARLVETRALKLLVLIPFVCAIFFVGAAILTSFRKYDGLLR